MMKSLEALGNASDGVCRAGQLVSYWGLVRRNGIHYVGIM